MKYFDKNFVKFQQKQGSKSESDWHDRHTAQKKQELKKFAKHSFIDKEWWRILSWDEREKVHRSYYDTFEDFQRRLKEEDQNSYLWYSYNVNIAEVTGSTWDQCIPQWLEYVTNKFPEDAAVRRDLAIRRIFS